MARVRCIMMQKNETLLVDAWFRYYGYLFGFENLEVFDNGSTDERVIAALRTYERAGCRVHWTYTTTADFHGKGFHFTNIVRHWDASEEYDFALPVDCDEFLGVFDDMGFSCNRRAIHDYLDTLRNVKSALGMSHTFYNDPLLPAHCWLDEYGKTFLPTNSVEAIDHGFHASTSRLAPGILQTNLAYIHLHNKPFDMLLEHARAKLGHFVDLTDREALLRYEGPGLHLTKYFLMDRAEYELQYEGKTLALIPEFNELINALGIENDLFPRPRRAPGLERGETQILQPTNPDTMTRDSHRFDGHAYTKANPDVGAMGYPPLKHYLLHGLQERRPLAPA